jgi:hypothetical protein
MDSYITKMKSVLTELIEKCNERVIEDKLCANCRSCANDEYTTEIYWCKYSFCSGWCQYDYESYMRKN